MAYLVIKTIKGIRYVYSQETYRLGKKVCTKSRCLGREDKVGIIASKKSRSGQQQKTITQTIAEVEQGVQEVVKPIVSELTISEKIQENRAASFHILQKPNFNPEEEAKQQEARQQTETLKARREKASKIRQNLIKSYNKQPVENAQNVIKKAESGSVKEPISKNKPVKKTESIQNKKKVNTTNKEARKPSLHIEFDLDKKKSISQTSLEKQHEKFLDILEKIGLDISKVPHIHLVEEWGAEKIEHKKSWFSKNYKVIYPKFERGNMQKFRIEFRRTVARAGIDLIKKQNPELYKKIRKKFSGSYKATQNYHRKFILNTEHKNRKYIAVTAKNGYFPNIKKHDITPENFGTFDDTRRESWEDEAAILLGEAIGGNKTLKNKRTIIHNKAKKAEEYAHVKYKREGGSLKSEKYLKRATARREATGEILEKLKIVEMLYGWDGGSGKNSGYREECKLYQYLMNCGMGTSIKKTIWKPYISSKRSNGYNKSLKNVLKHGFNVFESIHL